LIWTLKYLIRIKILEVNGWNLYIHPLFKDQLTALMDKVEDLKDKKPDSYESSKDYKILAAINKLTMEAIPSDPGNTDYSIGNTMGAANRKWKRAKFYQQYRLFFRYDHSSKTIVYAWVNDEETKRSYGSKDDAYVVFKKMLKRGNPPNIWDELMENATRLG
jgi:toxin YhaV